jgi:hypothetical protein
MFPWGGKIYGKEKGTDKEKDTNQEKSADQEEAAGQEAQRDKVYR